MAHNIVCMSSQMGNCVAEWLRSNHSKAHLWVKITKSIISNIFLSCWSKVVLKHIPAVTVFAKQLHTVISFTIRGHLVDLLELSGWTGDHMPYGRRAVGLGSSSLFLFLSPLSCLSTIYLSNYGQKSKVSDNLNSKFTLTFNSRERQNWLFSN